MPEYKKEALIIRLQRVKHGNAVPHKDNWEFEDFVFSPWPEDETKIWFCKSDGEGMVIKKSVIAEGLEKLFREHM